MYLYIIYLILLFVAYLELDHFRRFGNIHKVLFFVFIVVFFLLSSLRWERGTDWGVYLDFYNSITTFDLENWYYEWGYSFINYAVKVLFNSYTVLLSILAFVLYLLMGTTIYRYNVYPIFVLAIWFATSMADIFLVRNTIAIALTVFSLRYIVERDFWKFACIIAIAMLFHKSAIIFLPAYYIYTLKLPRLIIVVIMGICIVVGLFFSEFILLQIGKLFGATFEDKIVYYLQTGKEETFGSAYSATVVLLKGSINRSLILIVLLVWMNNERKEDVILNGFVNFYIVGLLLFFITVPLSPAMGRVASYYNIFQIFLFPYVILLGKDRKNKIFLYLLVGIYFLIRLNGVIINYESYYIPYKSILDVYKVVEIG